MLTDTSLVGSAAQRLKALRLNRGLRVPEAAAGMGIAAGTLRRLEGGGAPHAPTALAVCQFYGVTPAQIWMPDVACPTTRPVEGTA